MMLNGVFLFVELNDGKKKKDMMFLVRSDFGYSYCFKK